MTFRHFVYFSLVIVAVYYIYMYIRRINDPLDYRSLHVPYEPRFSTHYFKGMDLYDPISYADALHAIQEFSRLYQSSFLQEINPSDVIRRMAQQRRLMHRYLHALRRYLPNDKHVERRLLLGLEHTDGGMAHAMSDVTQRFPDVLLSYGAGIQHDTIRSVDDTWH